MEKGLVLHWKPYPSLPKFSAEPPVYFHEWILKNGPGSEDQVEELLGFTFCLREIRVTATSVQFNWVMHLCVGFNLCRSAGFLVFSMKELKIVPDSL